MAESSEQRRQRQGRSPAYPSISLKTAIDKAQALYDAEGKYAAPMPSAFKAWGYGEKSSGARAVRAALRYFGLISVEGDAENGKVRLTEDALRIILDEREDQTEKKQIIRSLAALPPIHRRLIDEFPDGIRSEPSAVHFLVFTEKFNKAAATELVSEFKETASFAGLFQPDNKLGIKGEDNDNGADDKPPVVKVGDKIQWTSQGIDQFPIGGTVLGFSDDGQWVFTDQSLEAAPLKEVSLMEQQQTNVATPPAPPPHIAAAFAAAAKAREEQNQVDTKPGMRKAMFPVTGGDVTIVFPEDITPDALEELSQYLDIFLKKEKKAKGRGAG